MLPLTQADAQEFLFRLYSPDEESSMRRSVKFRAFKGKRHKLPREAVFPHLLPLAVRCGFTGPNAVLDFARSYNPEWTIEDLFLECVVRTIGPVDKDRRFKPGVSYEYRPKKHLQRKRAKARAAEPKPASTQVSLFDLDLNPKPTEHPK